jgi:putative hydroxymethylpyrimidine transport system ATP-binding protein
MSEILRAENLSKSFLLKGKPQKVLQDLSFTMDEDSFVCIVGASGCGKSTFLELLAGITKPDEGQIYFRDNVITGKSGFLGYMPQDDLLFPWLTVEENALLPWRARSKSISEGKARITELLPVFGLQDHARHLPYQLSGGLRQRTAFLRTCMMDTSLLLLDEPLAKLDAITRMQFQLWLLDINTKLKLNIILVTHDIDEALLLADVIYVMNNKPGRFKSSYDLRKQAKDNIEDMLKLKNEILRIVKEA